jgi:O-antigen/teichoic acid export membrane protein
MKKKLNIKNIFQRFKGLFSIGISDILGAGISSLFWLYVATLLSVEDYGKIFYFLAIGNIATSISLVGSKDTLMVYIPKNVKLASTIFLLSIILGSISSLIIFFFYSNSILGLYILGGVIFGLGASEILAKKLYSNNFVFLIIQKLTMVGLSIGLYYLIGMDGIILGIGLSFFPYLLIVIKEFKTTKIDFSLLKPRLGFMLNSLGQNLLATFYNQIDKLIVAPLLGFTLLANYQLGIQFIAAFQLFPLLVLKFTLPHDSTGNPNRNLKIVTVSISICFTLLILFLAPIVISIFFPKFIYVVDIIQILSISLIPLSINSVYASKFLGAENSRTIFIAMVLLFLTHISGIFILGNTFGIIGVAISYVLAMTAQTIFYFISDLRKAISKH